jgi:uncharacterized protein DUF3305
VSALAPMISIPIGIVAERRKATSPWVDFVWRPLAVLPGVPGTTPWTRLSDADDVATYYVGAAEIGLYRTETGNYRSNLAAAAPSVWVALRPTGVEPPYEIVAVTADPAEGESLTESGGDLVEAVPMPSAVREIVEAFVAEHHVERPFYKRQRDRADPEALARRSPLEKDRDE